MRRLVTHLIYQFPRFGRSDVPALHQVLANNSHVYFRGVEKGFDALYPWTISNLIGSDYTRLKKRIEEATSRRRKLFHGQLTSKNMTRGDLLHFVQDIRAWCDSLAFNTQSEFGYDGFARNSFQKSVVPDLWKRLKIQIATVQEYEDFVRKNMQG